MEHIPDLVDVINMSCTHFPVHDGRCVWICVLTPEARD